MELFSEVLALRRQALHLANVTALGDGAATVDHYTSLVTVMGMEFQTTFALTVCIRASSVPKIFVGTPGPAGSVMAAVEATGHAPGPPAGVPMWGPVTPSEIAMEMGLQTTCALTIGATRATRAPRTAVQTPGPEDAAAAPPEVQAPEVHVATHAPGLPGGAPTVGHVMPQKIATETGLPTPSALTGMDCLATGVPSTAVQIPGPVVGAVGRCLMFGEFP